MGMSGLLRDEAERQLALWLKASEAVSQSQAYTIAGENSSRSLTRADAAEIRAQITFWDKQLKRLARRGIGARGIVLDYT
jgi:hypothetical protein